MKKLILTLCSAILLTSCAGLMQITTPQTVALNDGNFRFIKSVSASTKATYVIGIGGLSNQANEDVIEKLITKAELRPNQALADIRIQTMNKCFLGFLVVTRTTKASATVVEFLPSREIPFAIDTTKSIDVTPIIATPDNDSLAQKEPNSRKPILTPIIEKISSSKRI